LRRYLTGTGSHNPTLCGTPSSASLASTALQPPLDDTSCMSRHPDAFSARLLARIASDACAHRESTRQSQGRTDAGNNKHTSLNRGVAHTHDPDESYDAASAVAEGCSSCSNTTAPQFLRKMDSITTGHEMHGEHALENPVQGSLRVEQREAPGWRCRSLSSGVRFSVSSSFFLLFLPFKGAE
jgi:hypothetical protein